MAGTKTVSGQTVDRIGAPGLSIAYSVQDGDDGLILCVTELRTKEEMDKLVELLTK